MHCRFIITITAFFICVAAAGQDAIRGKVVNEKGEPIAGASVFIPNSTTGTVSGANGLFMLQHVPEGNFILTVSSVGYELFTFRVATREEMYTCRLKMKPRQLDSIIVRGYDKAGWPKWGLAFSDAFIGNSAFAKQCQILNKEIIRFIYLPAEDALRAYCNQPLVIENRALGYRITVQLVDFMYYISKKETDYQVYCFFTPMQGTEDEIGEWKKNRERAYAFSLMYFMRSLCNDDLKNKFELHRMVRTANEEKKRVQQIYSERHAVIADSLNDNRVKENSVTKLIEKDFSKDSVVYYRTVLQQDDYNETLFSNSISVADITRKTDSSTVLLSFEDYLVVINKRRKEPREYMDYKNSLRTGLTTAIAAPGLPQYLSTEFVLTQSKPIEISNDGYFNNSNLFINGFWSWWEKMATRLPYEYSP